MADQVQWQFSGDYFENCSCTVVCPCEVDTSNLATNGRCVQRAADFPYRKRQIWRHGA